MSKSRRPHRAHATVSARKPSSSGRKGTRGRLAESVEGQESRGAVAVTVAWMLTLMATVLSVVGTLFTHLLASWVQPEGDEPNLLLALSGLLLFTGIVSATICLALTVAANRLRRRAPPWTITIFACAACLIPWVLLLLSPLFS